MLTHTIASEGVARLITFAIQALQVLRVWVMTQ